MRHLVHRGLRLRGLEPRPRRWQRRIQPFNYRRSGVPRAGALSDTLGPLVTVLGIEPRSLGLKSSMIPWPSHERRRRNSFHAATTSPPLTGPHYTTLCYLICICSTAGGFEPPRAVPNALAGRPVNHFGMPSRRFGASTLMSLLPPEPVIAVVVVARRPLPSSVACRPVVVARRPTYCLPVISR